jgi:hypothetical protein
MHMAPNDRGAGAAELRIAYGHAAIWCAGKYEALYRKGLPEGDVLGYVCGLEGVHVNQSDRVHGIDFRRRGRLYGPIM